MDYCDNTNSRSANGTLPPGHEHRYVWIVTRATTEPDGSATAEVLHRCSTQSQAKHIAETAHPQEGMGYEGPVRRDLYPLGRVFTISDAS